MNYSTSLKLNHIFRRLYHTSGVATAFWCFTPERTARAGTGWASPSAKAGQSHVRNRTRRRIREVYPPERGKFQPGWDIVVVARTKAVEAPFEKLTASYLTLAKKAGLLKKVET